MQEYFLHVLKFFLHMPEENRIFPTSVGTILPALFKVQEAFNTSELLFSHIHGHYFGTCSIQHQTHTKALACQKSISS